MGQGPFDSSRRLERGEVIEIMYDDIMNGRTKPVITYSRIVFVKSRKGSRRDLRACVDRHLATLGPQRPQRHAFEAPCLDDALR